MTKFGPLIWRKKARIVSVERERPGYQQCLAIVAGEGEPQPAICFPQLTGPVRPGDDVLLNTTAVRLQLGSGGFHFVIARLSEGGPSSRDRGSIASAAPFSPTDPTAPNGRTGPTEGQEHPDHSPDATTAGEGAEPAPRTERDVRADGHIMKLRYTPLQLRVQAVDEEGSPHRPAMVAAYDLAGRPVVIGSVHSHLVPAVAGVRAIVPRASVGYVMTDGGSLPASYSAALAWLRERGYVQGCVTSGHAFGGDLEAVNVYSALLAARAVIGADVTVVTMGPGVVGTGTVFGSTALEVAQIVDAAAALGGLPVVIPRLSAADPRERHRGVSHHTLTALGRLCYARARVVLPVLPRPFADRVEHQLKEAGVSAKHEIVVVDVQRWFEGIDSEWFLRMGSMGRKWDDDPPFFQAAVAAGIVAARLVGGGER